MDPKGVGTVSVELNNTAAQLLARMCVQLDTEDASGVISRALGMLDLGLRAKRDGSRLCFVNQHGELSDVVI